MGKKLHSGSIALLIIVILLSFTMSAYAELPPNAVEVTYSSDAESDGDTWDDNEPFDEETASEMIEGSAAAPFFHSNYRRPG